MSQIEKDFLSQDDDLQEVKWLRGRLGEALPESISDEELLWMLDALADYYCDSGVLEAEGDEVVIDLEAAADYVLAKARQEAVAQNFSQADVVRLAEADLDYQELNA